MCKLCALVSSAHNHHRRWIFINTPFINLPQGDRQSIIYNRIAKLFKYLRLQRHAQYNPRIADKKVQSLRFFFNSLKLKKKKKNKEESIIN